MDRHETNNLNVEDFSYLERSFFFFFSIPLNTSEYRIEIVQASNDHHPPETGSRDKRKVQDYKP